MKTKLLIIIGIAAIVSGLIIVLGSVPEEAIPEPEGGNPKLAELMESGGFIVETRTLRFPERTYTTLANAEDTKNEWFIVNGVLAFGSETHEVIIPTTLDLYTDDGKVTSVMSYVSLEETIEYAKTLELNSGYIDLNDYVDPNWTDVPTETLDEVPQVEPEPEPQPETMSEGIPNKKFAPTEESFDGVFGIPITESEFNDVINYEPVKLHDLSEIIFNGQKLVLFEIRINPNTDIHYLYAPQTMKLNELKNKQDFFDSGGVLVKTVYLTNPTGVYQRLANDPGFEIEYLGTVPIRYHLYEEFNSLLLYPENERLVYIQTIADINKIKQLASSTKLKNDSLNLDDYVMTDWKLEEPKP